MDNMVSLKLEAWILVKTFGRKTCNINNLSAGNLRIMIRRVNNTILYRNCDFVTQNIQIK